MSDLPQLYYVTSSLDESIAFETWSAVIAPLFEPRPCGPRQKTPTGSVNGIIIRDLLIARVAFNAQDFFRDEERISTTPDHLLLHLYERGGFTGAISGQRSSIGPGKVAIIDLGHPVDTRAFASNTLSLIVPKKLLNDEALKAIKPKLDPFRNDLLAAYIVSLQERSAQLTAADVTPTVNETADFLNRLFVCTSSEELSIRQHTDETLLAMSEALIRDNLALPELSPDWLAGRLSVCPPLSASTVMSISSLAFAAPRPFTRMRCPSSTPAGRSSPSSLPRSRRRSRCTNWYAR